MPNQNTPKWKLEKEKERKKLYLRNKNAQGRQIGSHANLSPEKKQARYLANRVSNRNYRLRNKVKNQARSAVTTAIKNGSLIRPSSCVRCGAEKPHAHHYAGYEKENALKVMWLCRMCHVREHRIVKDYIPEDRSIKKTWKLNEEDRARILEQFLAGVPRKKIQKDNNVATSTIYRIMRAARPDSTSPNE